LLQLYEQNTSQVLYFENSLFRMNNDNVVYCAISLIPISCISLVHHKPKPQSNIALKRSSPQ